MKENYSFQSFHKEFKASKKGKGDSDVFEITKKLLEKYKPNEELYKVEFTHKNEGLKRLA